MVKILPIPKILPKNNEVNKNDEDAFYFICNTNFMSFPYTTM